MKLGISDEKTNRAAAFAFEYFLVACNGDDFSDPIVFNRELDFKSVFDTQTGAIFSIGEPCCSCRIFR